MAWVAVAIGAGSVISSVSSSRSADKASDAASAAEAERLAFEKERYADWMDVYGPIQDNLANYYGQLDADSYAAVGLEAFEQEYQTAQTRMAETFAQRGIDPSSGIAVSMEAQGELDAAEQRAGIRRGAESAVIQEKSNFLGLGLGSNPAASVGQAYGDAATGARSRANQSEYAAGQAWGAAIPAVGDALYAASNYNPAVPQTTYAHQSPKPPMR